MKQVEFGGPAEPKRSEPRAPAGAAQELAMGCGAACALPAGLFLILYAALGVFVIAHTWEVWACAGMALTGLSLCCLSVWLACRLMVSAARLRSRPLR